MSTFASGAAPKIGSSYPLRINSDDESDDLTHFGGAQDYSINPVVMDLDLTANANADSPAASHFGHKRFRSADDSFEDSADKKKSADDDDSDSADFSPLLSSYRSDTHIPLLSQSFKQLKEVYLPPLLDLDSKLLRREVKVESEETLINSVGHRVKIKSDYRSYFDPSIFKDLSDEDGLFSAQFDLARATYRNTLLDLFKRATNAEIHVIEARIVSVFNELKKAAKALIPTDRGHHRDAMEAAYNKLFCEVKSAREENKAAFTSQRRKQGGGPPAATAAIVASQTTTSKPQAPQTAAIATEAAQATTATDVTAKTAATAVATAEITTASSNGNVTNQEQHITVTPAQLDALVEASVKRALAAHNSTLAGQERKNPPPKNKPGPQQQPPPRKPPHQPEQGTARGTATVLAGGPNANKNGSHGNPYKKKNDKNKKDHRNPHKQEHQGK